MASSDAAVGDDDPTIYSPDKDKSAASKPAAERASPFPPVPEAQPGVLRPPKAMSAAEPALRLEHNIPRGPVQPSELSTALPAVFDVYGHNIGLALAAPIFDWLFRIQQAAQMDVHAVHNELISALKTYEVQAAHKGLTPVYIRLLLYGLAATIDDIVLKTSWGGDGPWAHKSMISVFFRETWGGERFYVLLSRMMSTPRSFTHEIELYYYCLQFGFEGRYRLEPQGAAELRRIREELYLFLRGLHGELHPELSPAWRGLKVERRRFHDVTPYWLAGAGLLLALACVFIVLTTMLERKASLAVHDVAGLVKPAPPAPPLPIQHPAARVIPLTPEPPPPPPPPSIASLLAPLQQAGLLTVADHDGHTVITTTQELFASGSISLRASYVGPIATIAQALRLHPGSIEVVGYTDDVPIHTQAYPDNVALSKARAKTVADMIEADLKHPGRVSSTGLGSADPIAPNTTPQGRQANRRVEITLVPPPISDTGPATATLPPASPTAAAPDPRASR